MTDLERKVKRLVRRWRAKAGGHTRLAQQTGLYDPLEEARMGGLEFCADELAALLKEKT